MASTEETPGDGNPPTETAEQSDRSLAEVGEAMTQELKKFEQLSDQLQKAPANSQKALERCAKLLNDVANSDERLGGMVRELVTVINRVRDRQHAQAEGIHQRALYIQQRTELFQKLMERYAELGKAAAELNKLALSIQGEAKNATNAEKNGEFVAGLQTLQESMGKLAEGAEILAKTADEHDFNDIGRNADSLRQQLLSTKNKVSLLQKSLPRV